MNNHLRSNPTRIDEPFRVFFPIGMILGIAGVALWPLFYSGHLSYYPGVAHTRLMVQGFAGLFIFGFLMTAGPRLLGVPSFSAASVRGILALNSLAALAHLFNRSSIGDLLFTAAVVWTLSNARVAFANRHDTPPPGFPVAALGLLCGAFGSLALAASTSVSPNATLNQLGEILLFQGFTMLPIIGVGAFFFPRLLGCSNKHDFPEMTQPNAAWKRRFSSSILVSIVFIASVILELAAYAQFAYALRLIAFATYILSEIPFSTFDWRHSMHGLQLIFALGAIVIGLAGAVFFPGYRIAWLHAYFLAGLTSIIFLVSIRVVFGHSGRPDLIHRSVKASMWITAALILAAATRIFADYAPARQISHYIYAAGLWLLCGFVWMILVAPKVRQPKKLNSGGY